MALMTHRTMFRRNGYCTAFRSTGNVLQTGKVRPHIINVGTALIASQKHTV